MLTIVCGEDSIASRDFFISLQREYKEKGYYLDKIEPNQIEEIAKNSGNEAMLFSEKKLYIVQHLTTFTARKKSKDFEATLKALIDSKEVEVLDWEEKSARDIKIKTLKMKEFKLSQSIFQLQEACYPKNLSNYIKLLQSISKEQEEGFIFTMLCRHIRTLLLSKTGALPSSVPFWMKKKFEVQADNWTVERLVGFYDGLAKLDSSVKTSSNLYGITGSLELLGCYFLN